MKKLKQQGIEVVGVVCHVSNAQQRKNLVQQTVQARMASAHILIYSCLYQPNNLSFMLGIFGDFHSSELCM